MPEKNDQLNVIISRVFPGDEVENPSFVIKATWKNTTAGNDAIQGILGVHVGEAFRQMQEAKDATKV